MEELVRIYILMKACEELYSTKIGYDDVSFASLYDVYADQITEDQEDEITERVEDLEERISSQVVFFLTWSHEILS